MNVDYSKYFCGEDGCCLDYDSAEVVILPVPYDGTSTWIKGSDKGPEALIEASGTLEMYDIETQSDPSKRGIYTHEPVKEASSPEDMAQAVEFAVSRLLKDEKYCVVLGGEHSISIGAFRAFANAFEDLSILQIDAHADLRSEYEGSACNHACAMYQAKAVAPIVQVGIRSMCEEERVHADEEAVFYRFQLRKNADWKEDVVNKLKKNVYLTIDLDAFDPSVMPSTGTPEPDGLLFHDVIELVERVSTRANIVGFDVVELCPNKVNHAPDFLAAKLIYRLLSIIQKNQTK